MNPIDRREALKRTAWIMGGAVSAPTMMGILNGCSVSNEPNWTPTFFTQDQAVTIMDITDIIIPKTDTPGAVEVGVPKFIESMVSDIGTEAQQQEFLAAMDDFYAHAEAQGGAFNTMNAEEKTALITELNKSAVEGDDTQKSKFYMRVKELTVAGFCTSEAGATQVLKYDPVPGEAKPCIPFEQVGKTWAT